MFLQKGERESCQRAFLMFTFFNLAPDWSENSFRGNLLCAPLWLIRAELTLGEKYRINLVDVDGHTFSIDDGHITTVVLTTQSNIAKARSFGYRTPDFCLGNPTYRLTTVLAFDGKHSNTVRMIFTSMVWRRLYSEAR